jgi:hypothetical protein
MIEMYRHKLKDMKLGGDGRGRVINKSKEAVGDGSEYQ